MRVKEHAGDKPGRQSMNCYKFLKSICFFVLVFVLLSCPVRSIMVEIGCPVPIVETSHKGLEVSVLENFEFAGYVLSSELLLAV